MEKLQLGRKRKTDAEKPRMDPLMRALKALHSAGSPETMTPEELEHQRRNQEILGRLTAPIWKRASTPSTCRGCASA